MLIIILIQNTIQLPLTVNSTVRPIAMTAGFTKVFNNMVELRIQVNDQHLNTILACHSTHCPIV